MRALLAFVLAAALACDANRVPDDRSPGADPIDRKASAEELYFEFVRLNSLGLVGAERMDALNVTLDRIEADPDAGDHARATREAIASMLRRTLTELSKSDPEVYEAMEAREYARRLNRQGIAASQNLSEVTLVVAELLGIPTSKGELALVVLLPAGGYLVGKIANVALKRAVFLLRRTRSIDDLVMASERLGVQFRIARTSPELASTIGGRPMDAALLARIKAAFERQGGRLIQSAEVDRYLQKRGVEAVTDNAKQVLLGSNPSASAVFEELIHTAQHRSGRFNKLVEQKPPRNSSATPRRGEFRRKRRDKQRNGLPDSRRWESVDGLQVQSPAGKSTSGCRDHPRWRHRIWQGLRWLRRRAGRRPFPPNQDHWNRK